MEAADSNRSTNTNHEYLENMDRCEQLETKEALRNLLCLDSPWWEQ